VLACAQLHAAVVLRSNLLNSIKIGDDRDKFYTAGIFGSKPIAVALNIPI
jgi:hypothetical protein